MSPVTNNISSNAASFFSSGLSPNSSKPKFGKSDDANRIAKALPKAGFGNNTVSSKTGSLQSGNDFQRILENNYPGRTLGVG